MAVEIERKFLAGLPPIELRATKPLVLLQGYLATGDGSEVRIRTQGSKASLTVKKGSGQTREEYEVPLQAKQFKALWPATQGRRIEKSRTNLTLPNNLVASLDVYGGALLGLRTVEVEFSSSVQAETFVPPPWFGPELTGNKIFSNASLSALDRPAAEKTLGPLVQPPLQRYGVVPIYWNNGEPKVIIINARNSTRWIFPKGCPEPDQSPQETALMEAQEEAGIRGIIRGSAIETMVWRDTQAYHLHYWPMEVVTMEEKWQEMESRRRRVVDFTEAKSLLGSPQLVQVLETLEKRKLKGL